MSKETEAELRGVGVSVHATFLVAKDCSASWPFPAVGLVDHGIVAVVVI